MKRRVSLVATAFVAALATLGCAHAGGHSSETRAQVVISRAIVVASEQAAGPVAGYAIFTNNGSGTSIVEATCDCADRVELHVVEPGQPMTNAWPLALPAGASTAIHPPGIPRHLMLVGTKRSIKTGDRVTIRFRLEPGGWVDETFAVVRNSGEAWRELELAEAQAR